MEERGGDERGSGEPLSRIERAMIEEDVQGAEGTYTDLTEETEKEKKKD